jgi:hypothetical protein
MNLVIQLIILVYSSVYKTFSFVNKSYSTKDNFKNNQIV